MAEPLNKPFYHLLEGRAGQLREMRLWSKVDMRGADECWDWQASRTTSGYGRFKIASRFTLSASRIVWALANKRDPGEMLVLHSCDRPCCCGSRMTAITAAARSDETALAGSARRAAEWRLAASPRDPIPYSYISLKREKIGGMAGN